MALGFDHPPPVRAPRRVVVTGIGLATPLGVGASLVWERLLAGRSGIRELTPDDIPEGERGYEQMPIRIGARVPRVSRGRRDELNDEDADAGAFDATRWCGGDVPVGDRASRSSHSSPSRTASSLPAVGGGPRIAPFTGLALAAAHEALQDARWEMGPSGSAPDARPRLDRCGVFIGAGMGHVPDLTNAGALLDRGNLRRVSPFFVPRILCNMAAGHVSMAHGFRGVNHAAATACASGAHAIGDAYRAVQRGDVEFVLCGGAESAIDAVSFAGFARARALADPGKFPPDLAGDPRVLCRPFDSRRGGFVMGEGAGVLALESLESAIARGVAPYAEVRGYGCASDAHHITQPPRGGEGAALAMRNALADGGIEPWSVGYVNAHATGTNVGDAAEAQALARVFGEAFADGTTRVSSTKGATGHLLGAAGAVEAAFAVLAVASGNVPPTLNLDDPCAECVPDGADFVPRVAARGVRLRAAMTNSFGFGGTNASLVFAAPPRLGR
uniref:beta-ketoacyl-[acyl-carrier-protein] synthase I n=1 Tax=Micromonas pusilla TaxID=38833 RepID=A0A7S0PRK2_MICPS